MTQRAIYILRDTNDDVIWVGQTKNIKSRLKEHRARFGKSITAEIVDPSPVDADESECRWIAYYRARRAPLRNIHDGGQGLRLVRDSTRAKISAFWKGKPKSQEQRRKIGNAQRGKKKNISPEGMATRLRCLAAGRVSRPVPVEIRARISVSVSKSLIGNQRRKGIAHSEDTKRRIAESMRRSLRPAKVMSDQAKKFWASLTPESRAEYIARREAARQAALRGSP